MLTSKKVVNAINKQIGNEFGASLQYVAIAAYFAGEALPQLAEHFLPAGGRRKRSRDALYQIRDRTPAAMS